MTRRRAVALLSASWSVLLGAAAFAGYASDAKLGAGIQAPVCIVTIASAMSSVLGSLGLALNWRELDADPCHRCAQLEAENAKLLEAVRT